MRSEVVFLGNNISPLGVITSRISARAEISARWSELKYCRRAQQYFSPIERAEIRHVITHLGWNIVAITWQFQLF